MEYYDPEPTGKCVSPRIILIITYEESHIPGVRKERMYMFIYMRTVSVRILGDV